MAGRRRSLTPEERALWRGVAGTTLPLHADPAAEGALQAAAADATAIVAARAGAGAAAAGGAASTGDAAGGTRAVGSESRAGVARGDGSRADGVSPAGMTPAPAARQGRGRWNGDAAQLPFRQGAGGAAATAQLRRAGLPDSSATRLPAAVHGAPGPVPSAGAGIPWGGVPSALDETGQWIALGGLADTVPIGMQPPPRRRRQRSAAEAAPAVAPVADLGGVRPAEAARPSGVAGGDAPVAVPADAATADRLPEAPRGRRGPQPPAYTLQPAPLPGAPALDRRTRARLARGRLALDGRLDLHGLTQEAAIDRLHAFLTAVQAQGGRLVLVITGKGQEAPSDRGILRRNAPHWLTSGRFRDLVAGFDEATGRHGGTGALYVRLRRKR